MLLNELKNTVSTKDLILLLKEYFGYNLSIDKLNIPMANKLLESSNKKLLEFKNSDLFHTSENSSSYIGLLTTKQLLESFLKEVYIPKEDIFTYNKRNYYKSGPETQYKWYRLIKGKDGNLTTKVVTNNNIISNLNDLSLDRGEGKNPSKQVNPVEQPQVNPVEQPQVNKTQVSSEENNEKEEPEEDSIYNEPEENEKWHQKVLKHATPAASHAANFLGATVGAFKAGLRGEGIHKDWGKMLPSARPINKEQLKKIIDDDFLKQNPFINLNNEQKILIEKFFETVYTPGKRLNHTTVLNMIKKDKTLGSIPNEVKAQIGSVALILNKFAQKTNESVDKSIARMMLEEHFNYHISEFSFTKYSAKLILEKVYNIINEIYDNNYSNSLNNKIKTAKSIIKYIKS